MRILYTLFVFFYVTNIGFGANITFNENPIQIDSIIQTEETCNLSNGTISIYIKNAGPQHQYSVDAGATYQPSNVFTGLPSNDYLIIITDGSSCTEIFTAQIADGPPPSINIVSSCAPGLNAINIEASPLLGLTPFTYKWEGPDGNIYNTETLTEVIPGLYNVTVTDVVGCTETDNVSLTDCCALNVDCTVSYTAMSCIDNTPPIPAAIAQGNVITSDSLVTLLQEQGIIIADSYCGDLTVDVSEIIQQPAGCQQDSLITIRTYIIMDNANVPVECVQRYAAYDVTPLEITIEAKDIELNCTDNVDQEFSQWLQSAGGAMYTACSIPAITTEPAIPAINYTCPNNGSVEVKFTIADKCGRTKSTTATFSVLDTLGPVVTCPTSDLDIDISDPNRLTQIDAWISTANVTDNCGQPNLNNDFDPSVITADCNGAASVIVTFSSADQCGMSDDCQATINVITPSTPAITCGLNLSVDCADNLEQAITLWQGEFSGVNATGQDLPVTMSPDMATLAQSTCGNPEIVTFSILDECNRELKCEVTLEVIDNELPEITCPTRIDILSTEADATVLITDWLAEAVAMDNCSAAGVAHDFDTATLQDICNLQGEYPVNFTTSDNCGNNSDCSSVINLINNALTVTCGQPLEITCDQDIELQYAQWLLTFSELESTPDITIAFDADEAGILDLNCGDSQVINLTATDNCGRSETCATSISLIDDINPVIICPSALTIEASSRDLNTELASWLTTSDGSDNCNLDNVSHDMDLTLLDDFCNLPGSLPVTFTAIDNCGNSSECTASINFRQTAPSLSCPAALEVECGATATEAGIDAWLQSAEVNNNNGNPVSNTFSEDLLVAGCSTAINIDFSTRDNCSISANCVSSITIVDNTAPVINCPNPIVLDISVNNNATALSEWLESTQISDCNAYESNNDWDRSLTDIQCSETIAVTFTAIDACGNANECISKISIENNGTIEIECPDDYVVKCSDPQLENKIGDFLDGISVMSDNTFSTNNSFSDISIDIDCEEREIFEVTFQAIDVCGTSANCVSNLEIIPAVKLYVPNVFTPEVEGLEDMFTIYANESVEEVVSLSIYNKWGDKVFEAFNFLPNDPSLGWDGRYQGDYDLGGSFTYYAVVVDVFGEEMEKAGSVQSLR